MRQPGLLVFFPAVRGAMTFRGSTQQPDKTRSRTDGADFDGVGLLALFGGIRLLRRLKVFFYRSEPTNFYFYFLYRPKAKHTAETMGPTHSQFLPGMHLQTWARFTACGSQCRISLCRSDWGYISAEPQCNIYIIKFTSYTMLV